MWAHESSNQIASVRQVSHIWPKERKWLLYIMSLWVILDMSMYQLHGVLGKEGSKMNADEIPRIVR